MKLLSDSSRFTKSLSILMMLAASFSLKAQTAEVINHTIWPMTVDIYGMDPTCNNLACMQSAVVPAGGVSTFINLPCTGGIVHVDVSVNGVTSPKMGLSTPGCYCSGAILDANSFLITMPMAGPVMINGQSECTGTADVYVEIW